MPWTGWVFLVFTDQDKELFYIKGGRPGQAGYFWFLQTGVQNLSTLKVGYYSCVHAQFRQAGN